MELDELAAVDSVTTRLSGRFSGIDPDVVRRTVAECFASYDGRPLRHFVPLLVEHDVVARLGPALTRQAPARSTQVVISASVVTRSGPLRGPHWLRRILAEDAPWAVL